MTCHSKIEIQEFLRETLINYNKGDAESLKRCVEGFVNLRKDFEKYRQDYLSKVPEMNIYHFVQFLAQHGLAGKLPREGDRIKFVLNLAIQQQWKPVLKKKFHHVIFYNMKRVFGNPAIETSSLIDGIKNIHQMSKSNANVNDIMVYIASIEKCNLSYVTYYHENDTTIVITYIKNKTKNQILHKCIYIENQIFIYDRFRNLEFRDSTLDIKQTKELFIQPDVSNNITELMSVDLQLQPAEMDIFDENIFSY